MIKVINLVNTDANENTFKISAFSDTKEEVTSDAVFIGLPEGATIEMGSAVMTASGELAFMKSDGTWNWVDKAIVIHYDFVFPNS